MITNAITAMSHPVAANGVENRVTPILQLRWPFEVALARLKFPSSCSDIDFFITIIQWLVDRCFSR